VVADVCSVFLQVSTQDEDSFTVVRNGEFLGEVNVPRSDGVEILGISALCEHDIDFKAIANLDVPLGCTRE